MRIALGLALGVGVAAAWNVGIQFLVWGDSAPTWYLLPVLIVAGVCGFGGGWFGFMWEDSARGR